MFALASSNAARFAAYAARFAALAAFVLFTNDGFIQRIVLLVEQGRFGTLAGFVGVWMLALVALVVAALQPNLWLRSFWALVLALTSAAGFAYHRASGSDLGIFDAISLWNARHEAARAFDFYGTQIAWLAAVAIVGTLLFAAPPVPRLLLARRWLTRFAFMPALPIAVIAATVMLKEGGGAQVLPSQFAPLSVGLVVATKLAKEPPPARNAIAWTWRGPFAVAAPRAATAAPSTAPVQGPAIRRIVILVDESIRADYIDWRPGNPFTPELAARKARLIDFGPAASGGNCSHYSNAILRFAAPRDGLGRALLNQPTLWQYAKKAGFRTVFIDAQAAFNRNPGKLQNFMTAEEARDIDAFHALDETTPSAMLDDKLLDITLAELKSDQPVLIYANKNGAHFPYDRGYPDDGRRFRPTMGESASDQTAIRINSYRNVVAWSVDHFFKRLLDADLKDTVVIYTSDHGQAFNPGRLTHCSIEDPDPREGLVPLFVTSDREALRGRFAEAAAASRGRASHFAIAPTVLALLGFDSADIGKTYRESLLTAPNGEPSFTSGDIFGLFSDKVRWHSLDLTRSYLEPDAAAVRMSQPRDVSGAAKAARAQAQ